MWWYKDKDLKIGFNTVPFVKMDIILPYMSKKQKENIKKYPFVCLNEVKVYITYKEKAYVFTINKRYRWDGATIPKFLWSLFGSNTSPAFLIASLVHDLLCENKLYIGYNRYLADKIFERLLYVANEPLYKRLIMFYVVEQFQKLNKDWNKGLVENG